MWRQGESETVKFVCGCVGMWVCGLEARHATHIPTHSHTHTLQLLPKAAVILVCAVLFCRGPAFAEAPRAGAEPVDVRADKVEYDRSTGWAEAAGHVVIRRGEEVLTADYVRVNTETQDAEALGNVVLKRGDDTWTGEFLSYNFLTNVGSADDLTGKTAPFQYTAADVKRGEGDVFVLHDAEISTCALSKSDWHYRVRARRVTIVPGDHLKAHHVVWYFDGVPSFYFPYWYRDLEDKDTGLHVRPGYKSRMGAFLLTSYRYRLAPWLKAETHLDYRTRRGFAVGQDFLWHVPDAPWYGDLELYYLNDNEPIDDDEDAATADIDSQRHRVRLRHRYYATSRDYVLLQAYHLSDTDVLEDFFGREYQRMRQPENYLVYTHRGDRYTAGAQVRKRFNDFYTTVERLPEASIDVSRLQIGDSGFYYEGDADAAFLRRLFRDMSTSDDYDALRADSAHEILRPFKTFGFLNLIPRAGYRGTWYSKTLDAGAESGAGFRSVFELGQEVSFKAFRIWDSPGRRAYRHVVEPYADYTYVPEPNLTPDRLYQFDRVDRLDEVNKVKLGVRNKLQIKKNDRPWDLVDLNVYTYCRFERPSGDEPIEDIHADGEFYPCDFARVDMQAEYNLPDTNLDEINTRVWLWHRQVWSASVEQRYRHRTSNLWSGGVTWKPVRAWAFNTYGRMEFKNDRVEEVGGYVQRNYDCMSVRTGAGFSPGYTRTDGTETEDDWRVVVEFWLSAFPRSRIGLR